MPSDGKPLEKSELIRCAFKKDNGILYRGFQELKNGGQCGDYRHGLGENGGDRE